MKTTDTTPATILVHTFRTSSGPKIVRAVLAKNGKVRLGNKQFATIGAAALAATKAFGNSARGTINGKFWRIAA